MHVQKFVLVLIGATVSVVLRSYILTILWGWFIVGIFGLPTLSIAAAVGVSVVAAMLTHQTHPHGVWEGKDWEMWTAAFLNPLMALGIGWIAKQFLA